MTSSGDEPKFPASSIASDETTAAMDEAMNDADVAVAAAAAEANATSTTTTTAAAAAAARPPAPSPEDAADAAAFKEAANKDFKEKHYVKAVSGYSAAISLDPTSAVLYSNRAAAHLKLENYGSALADAGRAIELDPKYVKAYYRRADASAGLGRVRDALRDFRTAAKVAPRDPDLRAKLKQAEREVARLRFEAAIAVPDADAVPVAERVDLSTMTVEASYDGPRMDGNDDAGGYAITQRFVEEMVAAFRDQKKIHKRFAFEIVLRAQKILRELPPLVDVPVPRGKHLTVCGDVHGQFYDLCNIFELAGGPPSDENPFLFNGDFVDRGSFSAEVILTLFAYKCLYPTSMHLARGNHETAGMNRIYGFDGEVRAKYGGLLADLFREAFCALPLGHVVGGTVLVVHGGLFSRDGVTLDDLRRIDRFREPPDEGLMCELLWSDPGPDEGRQPSKRGVGVAFGADVTKKFLEHNGLDLLVRSHEVKEEGYAVEHDGYCVTVFSAPNYVDQMGNLGAFIRFEGGDEGDEDDDDDDDGEEEEEEEEEMRVVVEEEEDEEGANGGGEKYSKKKDKRKKKKGKKRAMVPNFTTFSASPHPPIRPMAYASTFMGGMGGMGGFGGFGF